MDSSACIDFARGYKYQLRAPHANLLPELTGAVAEAVRTTWLELDQDGTLRFLVGYAWDGASGPTYDSKSSMRASLYHDGGYQLIRLGLLPHSFRPALDSMFYRVCLEDKMLPPRAWLWYHAVRIFADPATDPAAEAPDESAGCGCQEAP